MPVILGVAIMWDSVMYAMPAPARHHNLIWTHAMYEWDIGNSDSDAANRQHEQGFYDERGRFLTRGEAGLHALLFGQVIDYEDGSQLVDLPRGTDICSEELWLTKPEGLFRWSSAEEDKK